MSQFRVRLNNELIGAIQLRADQVNEKQQVQFDLPAEYFGRYNELQFELLAEAIGYSCTVVSPSAWLEFGSNSRIDIEKTQLVRASDLSWFPEPFVDSRDFTGVNLHYIMPAHLTTDFVQAAGILTSYFGMKAQWRNVTTERSVFKPTPDIVYGDSLDDTAEFMPGLPLQHAIVFMTNEQKPWQFHNVEPVTKPTIRMVTNPENRIYKMLLIHAPDAAGLTTAAFWK